MIVVGGAYHERCAKPAHNALMGSGLRAAGALTRVAPDVHLVSAIDDASRTTAEVTAGGLGVKATWIRRSGPVSFDYFCPMSPPTIYGERETVDGCLNASGEAVLVFGMLEANPTATGKRIVLDPQNPRNLRELSLDSLTRSQLAVVVNLAEARALSGKQTPRAASSAILRKTGAEAVVTKLGAAGCLVADRRRQTHVSAYPTASVFPIGTGDVFAAGFSWAWAVKGKGPADAARIGSAFAARWALTKSLPIPRDAVRITRSPRLALVKRRPQVYLAGPFFSLSQRWLVELARESILGMGARCFSPLHDVGVGESEVVERDLAGLRSSDAVLALCDEYDPGTVFEVGWAVRHGIPIVAFLSPIDSEKAKMMRGSGVELHEDFSSAVYRAVWRAMGAIRE